MSYFRGGVEYTPSCGGTGQAVGLDYRGRSVRCGECLSIVVHDNGDTMKPYVHWGDLAPTGLPWHRYTTRKGNPIGRLHVPANWRNTGPTGQWGSDGAE